ncbi:hypothetical protein GALMADRAFT_142697 [Galerina marginata CBS 339.88]|uniref:Glycoside hydrolase family 5 domain-containing protein n=1 Tax=Galerina marginata (strain CBS 339.88) TaxID=685588 RepID=A0A067SPZ6_GALM3|nr:hypothetical protein GALMADRAFT_142697 [Galerina marginata CBS 339.88]
MAHSPVLGLSAVKSQYRRNDSRQAGRADDSELKQAAEFRDPVGSGIPQIIALLSDSNPLVLLRMSMIIALLNDKDKEARHPGSRALRTSRSAEYFEPIRDAMPQIVELLNSSDKRTRSAGASLVAMVNLSKQAKHGIYTILDLYTAPGGQKTDWHSDRGGHIANFWNPKSSKTASFGSGELARHYDHQKHIAGYNALNEPTDAQHIRIIPFYDAVHTALRTFDPDHAIFFDGNTLASDFSHFCDAHKRWNNNVYSIRDYSSFGFPGAKAQEYVGSEEQKRRLRQSYEKKREWMDERGSCHEGDAMDSAIIKTRCRVLKDQLDIYKKDRLRWSIWLYKDMGFQGMIHPSPSTPYMTHFSTFLANKHRLSINA